MIKIPIPDIAYWWSGGNKKQLVRYMRSYMSKYYRDLKPIKISGKYVICEKK